MRATRWGWFTAAAMVAAAPGCSAGGASEDELNSVDAERVCQEFADKRLKAPGTADYDLDVTGGPTTYTVRGSIDAENSFGAKLREDVTCVVSISGDQWRLESLTGLD